MTYLLVILVTMVAIGWRSMKVSDIPKAAQYETPLFEEPVSAVRNVSARD